MGPPISLKKNCWYEICLAQAQKHLDITLSLDHCWHQKKEYPIYDISVDENQIVTSIMSFFTYPAAETLYAYFANITHLGVWKCFHFGLRKKNAAIRKYFSIFAFLSASTAKWLLERSHMIPHLQWQGECANIYLSLPSHSKRSVEVNSGIFIYVFCDYYLHLSSSFFSAFTVYTRSHSDIESENVNTLD